MRSVSLCAALFAAVVVAQEPTCRLEGRVLDPLQQPVANAELTASIDGEVVAHTHADGCGLFVFGRLPQRVVTVRATGDGPVVGAAWLDLLGLDRQFALLTAEPARAVRGRVCDHDGRPVAGAWLVSAPTDDRLLAVAGVLTRTGDDGTFTLEQVPIGANFVRVWAPGFACAQHDIGGTDDVDLACTLDGPAREQRRFELLGAPPAVLASARLVVAATRAGRPLPLPPPLRQTAAVDGAFVVDGWPVDDALTARLTLAGGAWPGTIAVPADRSGGRHVFSFVAEPPCVRGRVPAGTLPDGTWLVAEPIEAPGRRSFGRVAADGRFALPAPAAAGQRFALRALHPDWRLFCSGAEAGGVWWYDTVDPEHERELALAPAQRVRVRVQRHDGTPAAGCRVHLIRGDAWSPAFSELPEHEQVESIAIGWTGTDGALELHGLNLPDDVELHCVAEGADGYAVHTLRTAAEPRLDLGSLRLDPGAALEVRLVGDATHPVAGAVARVMDNGRGPNRIRTLVCDRDGRARITGLPPGNYLVMGNGGAETVGLGPGAVRVVELAPRGN
ncbi:MAG: carboxypeptidase regulatory-like domain-containing protein [Planctomycetes bacterium]|nr:carboxypeptidase regulatory-like domain-containing protein [Planctomycetota bacterium]